MLELNRNRLRVHTAFPTGRYHLGKRIVGIALKQNSYCNHKDTCQPSRQKRQRRDIVSFSEIITSAIAIC